jgi:hypothetical protein
MFYSLNIRIQKNKYMKQNKSYYKTSNLSLSATILCLGTPLDSVIKSPEGRSVFIFQNSEDLENIILNFWKRALTIEPNSFWDSIRSLKNIIHESEQQLFKGHTNASN